LEERGIYSASVRAKTGVGNFDIIGEAKRKRRERRAPMSLTSFFQSFFAIA
jgi:hypothetical protein